MGAPYGSKTLTELIAVKVDARLKSLLVQQAEAQQLSLSAVARLAMYAGLGVDQQETQSEVKYVA